MKTNKWLKRTALAVFITLSTGAIAQPIAVTQPQANYQEMVSQRQVVDLLIADALKAFKSPARVSHAGFTGKLESNMEIVAGNLLKAFELEPYRADLLFSAASAYIYNKDVDKAIALYERILQIAPNDVDAHSYLAAWNRYKGNKQAVEKNMKDITVMSAGKAQHLQSVFNIIDRVSTMPLSDKLSDADAKKMTGPTAIVTLGYALNPDGSMHQILIERLEKTLELAKQLPDAMIAVTGGVPQNNQTEADLMAKWLVAHGVDNSRIYQDNFARSTVENALFTRYALTKERIKHAVIISSGSHVRRAQAMFEIAGLDTGPVGITYITVAALDKPLAELQKVSDSDVQGIYRDSLKAMGLWSFRSYPLEER